MNSLSKRHHFLFLLFCSLIISALWIVTPLLLSVLIFLAVGLIARKSGALFEGLTVIGAALWIALFTLVLSPLSLIPSYLICMKMAKWLREKHGWSIYHPRKLFVLSILVPVGLTILFVIAGTLIQ